MHIPKETGIAVVSWSFGFCAGVTTICAGAIWAAARAGVFKKDDMPKPYYPGPRNPMQYDSRKKSPFAMHQKDMNNPRGA